MSSLAFPLTNNTVRMKITAMFAIFLLLMKMPKDEKIACEVVFVFDSEGKIQISTWNSHNVINILTTEHFYLIENNYDEEFILLRQG